MKHLGIGIVSKAIHSFNSFNAPWPSLYEAVFGWEEAGFKLDITRWIRKLAQAVILVFCIKLWPNLLDELDIMINTWGKNELHSWCFPHEWRIQYKFLSSRGICMRECHWFHPLLKCFNTFTSMGGVQNAMTLKSIKQSPNQLLLKLLNDDFIMKTWGKEDVQVSKGLKSGQKTKCRMRERHIAQRYLKGPECLSLVPFDMANLVFLCNM